MNNVFRVTRKYLKCPLLRSYSCYQPRSSCFSGRFLPAVAGSRCHYKPLYAARCHGVGDEEETYSRERERHAERICTWASSLSLHEQMCSAGSLSRAYVSSSEESRVRINSFITGQTQHTMPTCHRHRPTLLTPFAPLPVTAARVYVHTHTITPVPAREMYVHTHRHTVQQCRSRARGTPSESAYQLKNMHTNGRGHIRR